MKNKSLLVLVTSILWVSNSSSAQQADTTIDGLSKQMQLKQKSTRNTSLKRGRLTYGLGRVGIAHIQCKEALRTDKYGVQKITSNDASDLNICGGFVMKKNDWGNLRVGFEFGTGYSWKTVEYVYISNLGPSTSSYRVDYFHIGMGIPIRYYFMESKNSDVYVQGVFGYGFVGDIQNYFGWSGTFYGGGSIGARWWTIFFAEMGYNNSGCLRFGLSIPMLK